MQASPFKNLPQEDIHRTVAETSHNWEEWLAPDRDYLFISPACEHITGYRPDEFKENPRLFLEITHPDDREIVEQHCNRAYDAKASLSILEFRIIHRSGEQRWISHHCQPIIDQDGMWVGNRASNHDITRRKQTEEQLRQSKDQLDVILKGIDDGVYVIDASGQLIYANPAAAKLAGFPSLDDVETRDEIHEKFEIMDKFGHPFPSENLPGWRTLKGNPMPATVVRYRPRGTQNDKWAVIKATPIFNDEGSIQMVVVISHDISELKTAQLELEKGQAILEKRVEERTAQLAKVNQELRDEIAYRKRAEERIRLHATHTQALARVSARTSSQLDLDIVLNIICEETVRAIPSMPLATIRLYDEQLDSLYIAAVHGANAERFANTPSLPRAMYQSLINGSDSVTIVPDIQALKGPIGTGLYDNLFTELHTRTVATVNMQHNDELIGALSISSYEEKHTLSEDELKLLTALANQAAVAIANARLFGQLSASQERLQLLSQRLVEVQETERRNLAQELHDEIGSMLTSLNIKLAMVSDSLQAQEGKRLNIEAELTQTQSIINQLLEKVRAISINLRPALLDDLGLVPALLTHFENYSDQTGVEVIFKHSGLDGRYDTEMETAAFRIIQEALTNVARYGKIDEVAVRLWANPQMLGVQVEDHGPGFDLHSALKAGLTAGLVGMYERATSCGGMLEIESNPGSGTVLTAELPLQKGL